MARPVQTLVVVSCHGGSGATTLATTLAAVAAAHKRRVCLLDLAFQFGGVAAALGLEIDYPLSALFEDGVPDASELRRRLPRHKASKLWLISQDGHLQGLTQLRRRRFPAVLKAVSACFDLLVVDGVRDFGDHALAAIDEADALLLLSKQDVLGLQGLKRRVALLEQIGLGGLRRLCVLNSHGAKHGVPRLTIRRSLGIEADAWLSADGAALSMARTEGKSLLEVAPKSRLTREIESLAATLFALPQEKAAGFVDRVRALGRGARQRS